MEPVGPRMTGPGIRSWEFARVLAREHAVTLAAPAPVPDNVAAFRVVEARRSRLEAEVKEADVLVVQGTVLDQYPILAASGLPLVVDLYDPYLLENLELHAGKPLPARATIHEADLGTLLEQTSAGDFFLCASERQRHFWLGFLAAAGRVNPLTHAGDPTLERLLAVVPFGLPDEPFPDQVDGDVAGLATDDRLLLWWGGVWPWMDPETPLRAMASIAGDHPEARLYFFLSQPGKTPARGLAEELGLLDRNVFFRPWVAYDERLRYLARASAGVSCHRAHIETAFAFRTRILDYLWAGLPMVLSRGDPLAELVETEGAGLAAEPGDVAGVAEAMRRLLEDRDLSDRCSAAAGGLSERFRWSQVTAPLLEFCREPRLAPDRGQVRAGRRRGRRLAALSHKAYHSLREEGPAGLLTRGYRYVRKRST